MIVLIILVQLLGMFLAYKYYKWYITQEEVWSKGDRKQGLILSLFSYVTIIEVFLVWTQENQKSDDEPASW